MRKLRWGILGVAKINDRLLPAFALARNAELCAIASRSLERARSAAARAGIARAHEGYAALLDDPGIDAVYIPLPNTLHAEWTIKAAERGKHVLCEKPLAPNAAEAQRMLDFCRARGVQLIDGFMWPHHPRTARLRQFLDSGGIGEIRRVRGAFSYRMKSLDSPNIRLQEHLGGGSLLDVGCYPVFGIRWAFGAEPIHVQAVAEYVRNVDVAMQGLLSFGNGRMASFDCAFTLPLRQWLEIAGTEGVVRVDEMWLPPRRAKFDVHRDGQPVEEIVVEGEDQIVHMLEGFGRAVLEGTPLAPPPDEAVRTLRVLDALQRSARTGQSVSL